MKTEIISYSISPVNPLVFFDFIASEEKNFLFWQNKRESCVCIGLAQRLISQGEKRFCEIKNAGQKLLNQFQISEDTPSPRLFGGFAFNDILPKQWQKFGSAQFLLPRLTYIHNHETNQAWLQLFLLPTDNAECKDKWIKKVLYIVKQLRLNPNQMINQKIKIKNNIKLENVKTIPYSWKKLVNGILEEIQKGIAQKIVAARHIRFCFVKPLSLSAIFKNLCKQCPTSTAFLINIDDSTFFGATPETLIEKKGLTLRTEALAGSVAVSRDTQNFLNNIKEREEHTFVLKQIIKILKKYCSEINFPDIPIIKKLLHVKHLHSPVTAKLKSINKNLHILDFVKVLHPTPAVGGVPHDIAWKWIKNNEKQGRGWYAGPIGWFNADGDGDFKVALRSGLIKENEMFLYAGAGIVNNSNVEKEFQETELKLQAMRSTLTDNDD